ncbi:acyloxyacyl hydrolase [Pandoraea sp.]|uniref:acyloxyacyl hydrolase n=1 Tax=Pandoraea sp. TaxID=1883445 RepID=UPI0011F4192E|nr:acyloxyacyl hydrolase [Pandoraea sp.]TAL53364.1 MAG: acyloxyacyl hydrolase [Pandoraea sp.]TAM20454.1 MAG: acyloxyacyl hydrolase [Pandoraea sp.]
MNKKKAWQEKALAGALAVAILGASGTASADTFGVQLAGGIAQHHVRKLDLGVAWDPNVTWWEVGGWHFSLIGEAHLAWWHTDEGDVHENIAEVGVTPVVRFIKSSGAVRPFIEGGVGVRLLSSPTISSSYRLSTAFQFADMVGVGVQFGHRQQYLAGFRFQHVSNADIKQPNPGANFSQIYLQYNF